MKQLRTAIIVPGVIVLAGLLIGANVANAAPISAGLSASPKTATGKCPVKINFKGFIKSGKRGAVKYRFIRSDGAMGPIKTMIFSGPGGLPVFTTWTLGGPGLTSYSGWEQIVVLAPHRARSNRAKFKMRCDAGKGKGRSPDLISILTRPMSGRIKVRNIGSGPAGPSKLTLDCRRRGYRGYAGECRPENEMRLLDAYRDPAFPDKVVVRIPALRAGQTYTHNLRFWRDLRWPKGYTFLISAKADAGNAVAESNEGNNMANSIIRR